MCVAIAPVLVLVVVVIKFFFFPLPFRIPQEAHYIKVHDDNDDVDFVTDCLSCLCVCECVLPPFLFLSFF